MGLMNKLLAGGGQRSTEDYVELDLDDFDTARGEAKTQLHIAEIGKKQDVVAIKDALYDGNLVIADVTRHTTSDRTMEHIVDDLKQVAREVDGDIAWKDDDQLILTPGSVAISREKL